jgi:hypothetical protein
LVFLQNAVCLEAKKQIPMLLSGLTGSGLESTICHTRGDHVDHYTTDAVDSAYMYIQIGMYHNVLHILVFERNQCNLP